MNGYILVCPFRPDLINRLEEKSLAVLTGDTDEINEIISYCRDIPVHLQCIWAKTEMPLSLIPLQESWGNAPIALHASSLGRFRDFVPQLQILRKLNIRIYLPADSRENYAAVRILSSLGIHSAVVFRKESIDWELMADLMTYALLGLVPRASIEPFHFMAAHYHPNQHTDFSAVYLEDPRKYLHLDENGRVGLSQKDLAAGTFILDNVTELGELQNNPEYIRRCESWRDFFLQPDGCAYCQGWRVCLGRFSETREKRPGCRAFFTELMDAIEQYQSLNNRNETEIWQP